MVQQIHGVVPKGPADTNEGIRPHVPLFVFTVAVALVCIVTIVGLIVDDRTLGGVSVWLKPFKFTISFGIYSATLAWLLPRVTRLRRLTWWAGTVIAVSLAAEVCAIAGQAARGTYSHFNTMTPVDAFVIKIMTVGVVGLYLANLAIIVLLLRDRTLEPEIRLAFRLGLILAFVGMAQGFLMNSPTAAQQAAAKAGRPTLIGAHTVGVPDGGPGLPVTNWSTIGGDLRIPHFVAIHALQLLPLIALGLRAWGRHTDLFAAQTTRVRLVWAGAGAYTGLVAMLIWQAYHGQPLLRPDATTLGAFFVLIAAVALAAISILYTARRTEQDVR